MKCPPIFGLGIKFTPKIDKDGIKESKAAKGDRNITEIASEDGGSSSAGEEMGHLSTC